MEWDKLGPGADAPQLVNAVIEVPARAAPVKYEIDKAHGAIVVDRFINVPMYYPCNYGFVPGTLSEDGDPLDVLVATPTPVAVGAVLSCRPLGALEMTDEAGRDLKLMAVPAPGMNGGYDDARGVSDLPPGLLDQVRHFFEHYKRLEPGKWVEVGEWLDLERARREIDEGVRRARG